MLIVIQCGQLQNCITVYDPIYHTTPYHHEATVCILRPRVKLTLPLKQNSGPLVTVLCQRAYDDIPHDLFVMIGDFLPRMFDRPKKYTLFTSIAY
jgi:hypothetical protein